MTESRSHTKAELQALLPKLLPHRGAMLYIDELTHIDTESSATIVRITSKSMACVDGSRVPAWMGLEYMAQTVGIIAGYQAMTGEWDLSEGYLLGTRRFRSRVADFTCGTELAVTGRQELMIDAGIGSFSCDISDTQSTHVPLASCRLTIYRNPANSEGIETQ